MVLSLGFQVSKPHPELPQLQPGGDRGREVVLVHWNKELRQKRVRHLFHVLHEEPVHDVPHLFLPREGLVTRVRHDAGQFQRAPVLVLVPSVLKRAPAMARSRPSSSSFPALFFPRWFGFLGTFPEMFSDP